MKESVELTVTKADIDLKMLKEEFNKSIIGADEAKLKILMTVKLWKDEEKTKPTCISGLISGFVFFNNGFCSGFVAFGRNGQKKF